MWFISLILPERSIENVDVPSQSKVVSIDQEHDVIYYAPEEDNLNEPESPKASQNSNSVIKQSCSTQQIFHLFRNSPEASNSDEAIKKEEEWDEYEAFFQANRDLNAESIPRIDFGKKSLFRKDGRPVFVEGSDISRSSLDSKSDASSQLNVSKRQDVLEEDAIYCPCSLM